MIFLKHSITLLTTIALFSSVTVAATSHTDITIINHFDKPLLITKHINSDVLPGLPEQMTLQAGGEINTKVIDLQKKAYVRVEDGNTHSAYWGIKVENGQADIHGYISKGIAFSWDTSRIVFCTPEDYKQNKTCLK